MRILFGFYLLPAALGLAATHTVVNEINYHTFSRSIRCLREYSQVTWLLRGLSILPGSTTRGSSHENPW